MGKAFGGNGNQGKQSPAANPQPIKSSPQMPIALLCPYCRGKLSGERTVRCSVCGTRHHAACWKEHGKCSLPNCPGQVEISFVRRRLVAAAVIPLMIAVGIALMVLRKPVERSPSLPASTPAKMPETPRAPCEMIAANQELLEAARYNQTERIQKMIHSGTRLNVPGAVALFVKYDHCWTPLMTASYFGSADSVQLLLQAGAPLEQTDDYQRTALLTAVQGNHLETIRLLLKLGANTNAKDQSGDTCLTYTAIRGNLDILRDLIRARADINAANGLGFTPLIQAIRAKQWEMVNALLQSKADPNLSDKNGRTALSWVCETADPAIVEAVLNAGASVNTKDNNGTTPLMWATRADHPEVVKLLIRFGADIESTDTLGNTALKYAEKASETEIVRILRSSKRGN